MFLQVLTRWAFFIIMAKDPAFLFYPGDYLRDTQILSEAAQVAYDRIMCEHMRNICITQRQLKFLTKRLTDDQREEIMHVLTRVDGGFQITWVAESINKRRAYSESRRKNREGNKDEHMKNISTSYDSHMENEIENDNESTSDNENKNAQRAKVIDLAFEEFWDLYGVKKDKARATKAWSNLKELEKTQAVEYLPAYQDECARTGRQRRYPATYLNGKTWENEIEIGSNTRETLADRNSRAAGQAAANLIKKAGLAR